jgi:hypothetical protein
MSIKLVLTQLCQFKMIISYNSNGYDIFRHYTVVTIKFLYY